MDMDNLTNINLEKMNIKTRSVEAALAPIVRQIRKLVNPSHRKRKNKGESKKALTLVQALEVKLNIRFL